MAEQSCRLGVLKVLVVFAAGFGACLLFRQRTVMIPSNGGDMQPSVYVSRADKVWFVYQFAAFEVDFESDSKPKPTTSSASFVK